jgi:hypothetical protein
MTDKAIAKRGKTARTAWQRYFRLTLTLLVLLAALGLNIQATAGGLVQAKQLLDGIEYLNITTNNIEVVIRTILPGEPLQITMTPAEAANIQLKRDEDLLTLRADLVKTQFTPATLPAWPRLELHVPNGLTIGIENSNAPVTVERSNKRLDGAIKRLTVHGNDLSIRMIRPNSADLDLRGQRSSVEVSGTSGHVQIATSDAPVKIALALRALLEVQASGQVDIEQFIPRSGGSHRIATRSHNISLGLKIDGSTTSYPNGSSTFTPSGGPIQISGQVLNGSFQLHLPSFEVFTTANVSSAGVETCIEAYEQLRKTVTSIALETTNANIRIIEEK